MNKLVELVHPGEEREILGMLNYVLTRIVVQSMSRKIGRNYAAIAQVTGVLENVKQELYQAVARPLEDRKKLANGDCYKELQ